MDFEVVSCLSLNFHVAIFRRGKCWMLRPLVCIICTLCILLFTLRLLKDWLHKSQSPASERTHTWLFLIKLSGFNRQGHRCAAAMLTAVASWLRISNATGSMWLWADFDTNPRGTEFPSLRREIRCFIIGKKKSHESRLYWCGCLLFRLHHSTAVPGLSKCICKN